MYCHFFYQGCSRSRAARFRAAQFLAARCGGGAETCGAVLSATPDSHKHSRVGAYMIPTWVSSYGRRFYLWSLSNVVRNSAGDKLRENRAHCLSRRYSDRRVDLYISDVTHRTMETVRHLHVAVAMRTTKRDKPVIAHVKAVCVQNSVQLT